MQKFSFIKGLLIAGVLSAIFWVGVYKALSNDATISDEIETIETPEKSEKDMEIAATKASL